MRLNNEVCSGEQFLAYFFMFVVSLLSPFSCNSFSNHFHPLQTILQVKEKKEINERSIGKPDLNIVRKKKQWLVVFLKRNEIMGQLKISMAKQYTEVKGNGKGMKCIAKKPIYIAQ